MAKIWKARECVVKIASSVSIDTSAPLDTFFSGGTAIEGKMKNVTIAEPKSEGKKVDLLGEDSDGFQNAEMDESPYSNAEISGTLILDGDEVLESFIYSSSTAISTTHTRYRIGKGTRLTPAMLLNLDDGTDEVSFATDKMYMNIEDVKCDSADGHFEITFKGTCLPRNFYGPEFKD